ncbi:plasmid partitioning protein RepB [Agrobacterium sp.]|uniref:plasmid partitioning protein RepB n=1 Tax=Agrobacterium sp. TaxID=361 RepID=UPI0028AC271B|nr:plasmid partitioning protein RepB [Agrobacterium sp.]
MSRKDSRGLFANVLAQQAASAPQNTKTASPHLMKVAAGVRQIQERGEALDKLLAEGDRIVEVDADDVAPSSLQDRFDGSYSDAAIDEIVQSMTERGQIVPGMVRPTKSGSKPYQIVFGRRRLAAAKRLGVKFRAIVRELTDEQAVVFQGEENTNRNDLSYIEKCVFAQLQEQAGYGRDTIIASLATGKSHVSEMLRVAATIPRDTLTLIGRSPDIGRRRWMEFSELWAARNDAWDVVREALHNTGVNDSERFAVALTALKSANVSTRSQSASDRHEISANGLVLATIDHAKAGAKLNFTKAVSREFVEFLGDRLPALHAEYQEQIKSGLKG